MSFKVINENEDVYLHSQFVIANNIYRTKELKQSLTKMNNYFKDIIHFSHPNLCTIHQVKLSDRDGILILDILEDDSHMFHLYNL